MSEGQIVLASTTATQAELDHAMSDNWADPYVPLGDAPAEGAAPESAEGAEATETAAGETPEAAAPAKEKPGRWQDRVDKLTRRSHEQQSRIEELQAQLAALKPKEAAQAQAAPAAPSAKPQPDAFGTYEEYIEALTDWKVENKLAGERQARERETEQERATEVLRTYNANLEAARKAHPDFDEVIDGLAGGSVRIPEALQPAILEADNGPEIAYHIATHPEVAEKLCEMSLARAAVEVGKISASLSAKPAATPAKPKPAATTAPAPINPVAARGTAQPKSLWELPYREWKKRYDAGER